MSGEQDDASSDDSELALERLADLFSYEKPWRARQPWLLQRGYQLRPRFRQGWVPSWKKFMWLPSWARIGRLDPYKREDSVSLEHGEVIMDAVRLSDGAFVVMKLFSKRDHPYELEISEYFSSPELARDPRNHCVPILEAFDDPNDPDLTILVMPLLKRFDRPPFETVGELTACLTQVFEGLEFIHEHNVAHRDCSWPNIMMDAAPMYPIPYHPSEQSQRRDWKGDVWHYSRTQRPVKYYLIDFGLSRRYDPAQGPPREFPIRPADKSVPEHQGALGLLPSDPFATDIYLLGNAIRERFAKRCDSENLHFLEPLLSDMTQENPALRPNIHEASQRFADLLAGLDSSNLHSQLVLNGKGYQTKVPSRFRLKD
ncbi:hypothetical protein PENSPDRAFT_602620 [Peniophora sp. CONT]|nr:hypothetical protein PENSPDRAFT_602620 [Peniophora sp. CONT]